MKEIFKNESQDQYPTVHTSSAITKRQALFLTLHHQCVLCDAELEINHDLDLEKNTITETADCPQCRVRARAIDHKIS
jgi:hypothetical protein